MENKITSSDGSVYANELDHALGIKVADDFDKFEINKGLARDLDQRLRIKGLQDQVIPPSVPMGTDEFLRNRSIDELRPKKYSLAEEQATNDGSSAAPVTALNKDSGVKSDPETNQKPIVDAIEQSIPPILYKMKLPEFKEKSKNIEVRGFTAKEDIPEQSMADAWEEYSNSALRYKQGENNPMSHALGYDDVDQAARRLTLQNFFGSETFKKAYKDWHEETNKK